MATTAAVSSSSFEVWFASLFREGCSLVFPCDEAGHVEIDALSECSRSDYFFARAMLGREYATPRVVRHVDSPCAH